MKYMKFALAALVAAALLTTTTMAATNAPVSTTGQWSLTLAGAGSTATTGPSDTAFGTTLSLGHTGTLLLPFEAGLRQGIAYSSTDGGNVLLSTRLYADWTLMRLGSVELLAGVAVGPDYGNQTLQWRLAPELETRLWLKDDVYVFGRVSYGFVLNDSVTAEDKLVYGLGVGFRF